LTPKAFSGQSARIFVLAKEGQSFQDSQPFLESTFPAQTTSIIANPSPALSLVSSWRIFPSTMNL
jgi:hypothetical protein